MTHATTKEIWVFGDLRTRSLLEASIKVLTKAVELARDTGGQTTFFTLAPAMANLVTTSDEDACVVAENVADEAIAWGTDRVIHFENESFASPTAHLFCKVLEPIFAEHSPRLVMFPLSDFGRDVAARSAATARAGLMADCLEFKTDENGGIVGLCPAWDGEIMAQITYVPGHGTGFATVAAHGATGDGRRDRKGLVKRIPITDIPENKGIRLISNQPARLAGDDLEKAATVVVGGAGLGSMENFGLVRQLAVAMAGQTAATRPPVLNHWVSADRLIGQTGKTIRPRLLISVGTSGAIQYTAGIMESGKIVAINRDPSAPIFQLADIGVIADAATFLPILISRTRQAVMRRLADDACTDDSGQIQKSGLGEKIKLLREAQEWSIEHLAEVTGQTPEFIADVESGQMAPPVAFIVRLSGAYDVDPGTFLKNEEKEHIRNQRNRAYVNRTRNYSYRTLTSGAEHDHLRAFMVAIEPHHDHQPVAYKHEGEEFIFVMEGELGFTLGRQERTLKKGESIHFHSNTPHKLKSLSGQMTRCLVILYTI